MLIRNFTLCCQAPDSSSCFSTGNRVFARINLKPAVLKNFVFDWELCFHLCKVYRFQNLVGLELPIKHTPKKESREIRQRQCCKAGSKISLVEPTSHGVPQGSCKINQHQGLCPFNLNLITHTRQCHDVC